MKKWISVLLVLAMVFGFAACGSKNTENQVPEGDKTVVSSHYPVTVTDQAARTVTIEKEPEKLVSCYYIGSSLLIALDLDDKMVGIEGKADKRAIYKLSAPRLTELPSVGSAKEFDLEGCAALKPDLVILPLKLKDTAAKLDELGIQTLLINPESSELLLETIDLVAEAANKTERAAELKSFIEKQQQLLKEKLADAEKPTVYLGGNSNFLSTAGRNMYQNGLIELAGGVNAAAGIEDTYWAEVDYEQILAWNPQYIVLASDASYTAEEILGNEALSLCDAVQNGHVIQLPSDVESWDSPLPSGILGSVWLAAQLHPEAFSAEECSSIIKEFYETFYGFTYAEK